MTTPTFHDGDLDLTDLPDLDATFAADEDTDEDADDDIEVEDDEDTDDAPDSDEPGPARKAARPSAGAQRALIRRVAAKAGELSTQPAERLTVLAGLIGSPTTELGDLTYAVMTANRAALAPAADLSTIQAAALDDPFTASVTTLALGRPRMRAVWALARAVGVDLPAQVPQVDTKVAATLSRALYGMDQAIVDELASVAALARKS